MEDTLQHRIEVIVPHEGLGVHPHDPRAREADSNRSP